MSKTLMVEFEKGDALHYRLSVIAEQISEGYIRGEGWWIE